MLTAKTAIQNRRFKELLARVTFHREACAALKRSGLFLMSNLTRFEFCHKTAGFSTFHIDAQHRLVTSIDAPQRKHLHNENGPIRTGTFRH